MLFYERFFCSHLDPSHLEIWGFWARALDFSSCVKVSWLSWDRQPSTRTQLIGCEDMHICTVRVRILFASNLVKIHHSETHQIHNRNRSLWGLFLSTVPAWPSQEGIQYKYWSCGEERGWYDEVVCQCALPDGLSQRSSTESITPLYLYRKILGHGQGMWKPWLDGSNKIGSCNMKWLCNGNIVMGMWLCSRSKIGFKKLKYVCWWRYIMRRKLE